jgi:hypothetical protein
MQEIVGHYRTLGARSARELDVEVNKAIQDGWQPFGAAYTSTMLIRTRTFTNQ